MSFEDDIRIDTTALDVEWHGQAELMMKYTKKSSSLKLELDRAKEALEYIKAELAKNIRSNPDDYEVDKVTDKVVDATILLQPEYIEANDAYIMAKFEADVAQGAVRAIEQKKDALEQLVKLLGLSYFAGPRIPRELSYEVQQKEKQKRANTAVGAKMTRRR